jgi:hypothetical protein
VKAFRDEECSDRLPIIVDRLCGMRHMPPVVCTTLTELALAKWETNPTAMARIINQALRISPEEVCQMLSVLPENKIGMIGVLLIPMCCEELSKGNSTDSLKKLLVALTVRFLQLTVTYYLLLLNNKSSRLLR